MTSEINKRQAVAAYRQISTTEPAAPPTLKALTTKLQSAREQFPAAVTTVEVFVGEHGFKSFAHGVEKSDRAAVDSPSVSQAKPPIVPRPRVFCGVVKPSHAERHILTVLTAACEQRHSAEARIEAMVEAGQAASSFIDNTIGSSGAQGSAAIGAAVNDLGHDGKGYAIIEARDLEWGARAAMEKFDACVGELKAAHRKARENKVSAHQTMGNIHPKTPAGFVHATRGMVNAIGDSYQRAAVAFRDTVEAAVNLVAERTGASKAEVAIAAERLGARERYASGPTFIVSGRALTHRGEKAVRAAYERFVAKTMDEHVKPKIREQLEHESGTWVHPRVWQRWVGIAGAQPSMDCQAVKEAHVELEQALDPSLNPRLKKQIIAGVRDGAAMSSIADGSEAINKALDTEVKGPFTVEQAAQLGDAAAMFAARVSLRIAGQLNVPARPLVHFGEPSMGSYFDGFAATMLERANEKDVGCVATFNGHPFVVLPGDSLADIGARRDDMGDDALATAMKTFIRLSTSAQHARHAANFAEVSKDEHHTFDAVLGVLDLAGALAALSDANSIAKYCDRIAANGVTPDTVELIRDASDKYGESLVVPGTLPAWHYALEKLIRMLPPARE